VNKLLVTCDIQCVQETFFFFTKQDLEEINSLLENFHGAGESTTDLSNGIVHGRIPGGDDKSSINLVSPWLSLGAISLVFIHFCITFIITHFIWSQRIVFIMQWNFRWWSECWRFRFCAGFTSATDNRRPGPGWG